MILTWRGWGYWVPLLFAIWVWAGIVLLLVVSPYEPDRAKVTIDTDWAFAAGFFLYAASVAAIVQWRRRKEQPGMNGAFITPPDPDASGDEFLYIRMRWWPYIIFTVAAYFAAAATFGYSVFGK